MSEHSADDTDDPAEHLFKQGEITVFRGTDGLPFNLLKVTRDYGYNITLRTKIQGNFLVESDNLEDGDIGFREDRQWKGGAMNFAITEGSRRKYCDCQQNFEVSKLRSFQEFFLARMVVLSVHMSGIRLKFSLIAS